MKNNLFLLLILFTTSKCSTEKSIFDKGQTYNNFRGFEPVDPIEYDDSVQIHVGDFLLNKKIKLLTPEQILSFLNNETVLVSIGQINTEGGVTYLPVTVSAKHTSYKVTMDYMKFASLGQQDENGKFIGFKRVGVGLRLISLITTFEANLNIGDLSSLGVAAKAGKLKGTLMIEVIGIKSKEVTTLLPLPSEINLTTIQNAMQALATIKSKIYDSETCLYPQTMAIKLNDSTENKDSHTKKLNDQQEQLSNAQNNENNRVKLQISNNKVVSTNKSDEAGKLEIIAFQYLFDKEIDQALATFGECEKTFPGYHSAYDIKNMLQKERDGLVNKNSVKWKEIYLKILNIYSWKLSPDIKNKLTFYSK